MAVFKLYAGLDENETALGFVEGKRVQDSSQRYPLGFDLKAYVKNSGDDVRSSIFLDKFWNFIYTTKNRKSDSFFEVHPYPLIQVISKSASKDSKEKLHFKVKDYAYLGEDKKVEIEVEVLKDTSSKAKEGAKRVVE